MIYKLLLCIFTIVCFPLMGNVFAFECSIVKPCTFFWNADTESDLAGYKFYVKPVSGNYGIPLDIKTPQTAIGVDLFKTSYGTLAPGDYVATVTAYDTSGNESAHSNEVLFTFKDLIPPAIPTLQISVTVP